MKLDYTARMDNPLFTTDVGEVTRAAAMHVVDPRGGYLVLGPGIPLSAGTYRVRWNGTIESGPAGEAGFVQVCYRDCRVVLGRASISGDTREGVLAEVAARVPRDIRDVEYRVFATPGARITVQSIAISQQ